MNHAISKAVEEFKLQPDDWRTQKLSVALRNLDSQFFIDVRKLICGFKKNGDPYEFRSKKGIMLSVEFWPEVCEKINELVSHTNFKGSHVELEENNKT